VKAPFVLEREQWVPRPLPDVFAFFADAGNLEKLTPAWLRFEIVTPEPIEMKPGAIIDYKLHWHGVPLRWKTEITRWEPPYHFEDLQVKGPYGLWRHNHYFEAVEGGTRIRDQVEYALPFGLLGRVVHAVSVRRNVEEIFKFRDEQVRALFGTGKS
jgi:ligand-binding SRPBCC domain-containing protein